MKRKVADREDLLDDLHNLKIDLKDKTEECEETRREVVLMERENRELNEEIDRLSAEVDTIQESTEQEIVTLRVQLSESETFYKDRMDMLEEKYIRALSISKMIECGNMAYFQSSEGRDFLRWARDEFDRESHRKWKWRGKEWMNK